MPSASPRLRVVALSRVAVGAAIVGILAHAYVLGIPRHGADPFDYFGYFTNLTSLLSSSALIAAGALALRRGAIPAWLHAARGVAVSCMIVVALIYNLVVPGTGSAPPWVSATLHLVFPALLVADWLLPLDRRPLPWRRLWLVLPYPLLWLAATLVRGATDGWVPYGFLLPERGPAQLAATVAGLLIALLGSASAVWALTRLRPPARGAYGAEDQP